MLSMQVLFKSPSHILERGKGVEEIASSFLLFKKKKEGMFWKFLDVYAFEMKRESSLMLKMVLIKANVTLNVMVYSLA